MTRKIHPYYDTTRVCSYNAPYNFIVGARGFGKTYGFKKRAIKRNISHGEEFIYLRRYKEEMKLARDSFFNDIRDEFPEWEFKVDKGKAWKSPKAVNDDEKRVWEIMGYFVTLSTAQYMKSVSFHLVRTIIFDEFIIEKGVIPYLVKEAKVMLDFYSTVDRNQDKTSVYFLANSVSVTNPYFNEYKIRPDRLPEISTSHGGFILVEFPDSKKFRESVTNTRFGRFISGTEYEEFAVGNQFADGHDKLVKTKTVDARPRFNFETSGGVFSIWYDMKASEWYVQDKLIGGEATMLTLLAEKMDKGKVLVNFNDKYLSYLRTAFRQGRVLFDSPRSRNAFIEIFSR